ncbi:MAG: MFS transporter [Nitrospirae bacterium]|nr:MAG: MFS transporter [Nitrospirota bacterium]
MARETLNPLASPAPSPRARWGIVALLIGISIVTYLDRVNISVTARQMIPALGMTHVEMGRVFSAFVLGYALFQIPGGWAGDRWGPRWTLTCALIWWSIWTGMTALVPTSPLADLFGMVGALSIARFLIGVGEAAALPTFNRAVANWLAPHERGLGIALAISGIGIGSAITPPLTAWIMVNWGWHMAFYVSGAIGMLFAVLWFGYAVDHPHECSHQVSSTMRQTLGEETQHGPFTFHSPTPWKAFARTPTVWWLVASYTCFGYVAYVYMSWFYLYVVEEREFSILQGAWVASSPFLAIILFCPLGGWITDRLTQRMGVNHGRRVIGGAGMTLAGVCILLGAFLPVPWLALLCLSLGAGWLYFTIGAFWNVPIDLAKSHAGTLSGLMNTGANLGGALSPLITPWIALHRGWPWTLGLTALIALLGALCWVKIRPGDGLRHTISEEEGT